MLEWMHPWWFAALPLAILPWIAFGRPHALRFSTLDAVRGGRGLRSLASLLVPLLESLAIALVVVALARPQLVQRETVRESSGIDIMLAIDTSGSMESPDMGVAGSELTRLQAAKLVMAKFVEARPDDRLGLLVFGEEAFVQVPLTLDHEGFTDFVGQIGIGMAGKNATAVGSAIAVASKRMKDLAAPSKVVVLVTDGRSNAGIDPGVAAQAAAALGIRIYTIGVGGVGSAGPFGLLGARGADVDEGSLREVAAATGGKYWRATDAQALAEVYGEIDKLEKTTARSREFVHRDEQYLRALVPGIALFALQLLLSGTVLRRIP